VQAGDGALVILLNFAESLKSNNMDLLNYAECNLDIRIRTIAELHIFESVLFLFFSDNPIFVCDLPL
jgi:hypothetical protein